MRNTLEYPPTKSEILEVLERLLKQEMAKIEKNGTIGSMTPVLIQEAITRIKADTTFSLRRMDDNGNVVVVQSGLRRKHALELYDLLTRRGHKQVYHVVAEMGALDDEAQQEKS